MASTVEELLKQLKDYYNLDFYDLNPEEDKEDMIEQLEELKNLCSSIIDELEEFKNE